MFLGLPFGRPQLFAGLLLLAFAGQCLWLAVKMPLRPVELAQIEQGRLLLHRQAGAEPRAALTPILAALPLMGSPTSSPAGDDFSGSPRYPRSWRWRARLPFIAIGLMLGASLWYVARRLYGAGGGMAALTLYAFAPPIVGRAASVQPTIISGWGAFGVIFTAIAVAHTLYAPREVVLWNWRRILLLGIAIALAVADQVSLVSAIILAVGFMLYIAPQRRGAALVIVAAGCALAFALLIVLYGFNVPELLSAFSGLRASEFAPGLLGRGMTWSLLAVFLLRVPAVLLLLLASLITFVFWKRPRYFGVLAPLLVWAVLLSQGIVMPHLGGYNLFLISLPFAFVFISGIFSDLLETQYGGLVLGILGGVLMAHAAFSISGLMRFA